MSDLISKNPAPVFGVKAATILGVLFLALYTLFAVLGAADRAHRSRLETLDPRPVVGNPVVAPK